MVLSVITHLIGPFTINATMFCYMAVTPPLGLDHQKALPKGHAASAASFDGKSHSCVLARSINRDWYCLMMLGKWLMVGLVLLLVGKG